MPETDPREQKRYELRLSIEASMYELLETDFTIDEIEDFVERVLDEMKEEAQHDDQ